MPFINLNTNVEIANKESMKAKLGELIATIPGKSEAKTMVRLSEKQDLWFGGSDEPCAIVETLVNAGSNHESDKDYCSVVIDAVAEELNIPASRVYAIVDEQDFWFAKM